MGFKCALCADKYEDFSGATMGGNAAVDSDTCASCGYENSMSVTNSE
jgi:hypothetical protein